MLDPSEWGQEFETASGSVNMAVREREIAIEERPGPPKPEPRHPQERYRDEPPLGELFRQLSDDATRLVQQELALAKTELRQTGTELVRDGVKIGAAAGLALLGALAATAFLILALGALLGNYWLSTLIVAVLLLGAAAMIGKPAIDDIRERDLKPTETIATLRADADWAKQEAKAVKREWRS
jgi:hypothetical protein